MADNANSTIAKIFFGPGRDYFTPEVREMRPITDKDIARMREHNPGIDADNLRTMIIAQREREGSTYALPRSARANDPIHANSRIGTYLGVHAVWLKPGAGSLSHIVIEGYGAMGHVPKSIATFGAMRDNACQSWQVDHDGNPLVSPSGLGAQGFKGPAPPA